MKASTILFSLALAFKTIYSRAIEDNIYEINNQLNVTNVDNPYELIESNNFIYKLHCSEEKEFCDKIKNNLEFAFKTISNAFGKYKILFLT